MERTGFGARMRARRRELDITQEALARTIGQPAAAISHFECGRRTPVLATCDAIAAALGVSIDWLVRGPQPPQAGAEAQEAP